MIHRLETGKSDKFCTGGAERFPLLKLNLSRLALWCKIN